MHLHSHQPTWAAAVLSSSSLPSWCCTTALNRCSAEAASSASARVRLGAATCRSRINLECGLQLLLSCDCCLLLWLTVAVELARRECAKVLDQQLDGCPLPLAAHPAQLLLLRPLPGGQELLLCCCCCCCCCCCQSGPQLSLLP